MKFESLGGDCLLVFPGSQEFSDILNLKLSLLPLFQSFTVASKTSPSIEHRDKTLRLVMKQLHSQETSERFTVYREESREEEDRDN